MAIADVVLNMLLGGMKTRCLNVIRVINIMVAVE